jgi:hypothetical protein
MISTKKIFYSFSFLIFFSTAFFNFNNYIGNSFLFIVLQFSSFALFLTAVKKKNSAFEFFSYIFLLLSFWFRFNCILFFNNIKVVESDFDLQISNYDNSVFIIIVTFMSCICASFIKKIIINDLKRKNDYKINISFESFYRRYRFFIFFIFLVFLIVVYLTNLHFEIYFKGLINEHIPALINYIYSYLLVYGLAVIASILIYVDFLIFKNNKIFLLGLFEAFFTQLNILSRTFILSIIAYLRGLIFLVDIKSLKYQKFFLFSVVFLILIMFFISIYSVTKFRNIKYYNSNITQASVNATSTFKEILLLSTKRWVGIDGLLAVSQSNKLNFSFFISSLGEKLDAGKKSFYVENFYSKFEFNKSLKKNTNHVITPGIVSFLYYTGSAVFVFFGILILILICISIEKLFYHFSVGNTILANIVGYSLAIRFIHFGYVPLNIFNFLLSFFLTLIFVFVINKFIIKITVL